MSSQIHLPAAFLFSIQINLLLKNYEKTKQIM